MKLNLGFTLLLFLLFAPLNVSAGGDMSIGKVSTFNQNYGNYIFQFKPEHPETGIFSPCPEITIHLTYQHVPWYSWIPIVYSPHPSKETTLAALEILREAQMHQETLYFGAMVNGLKKTKKDCVFRSKGLSITQHEGIKALISFYDPL